MGSPQPWPPYPALKDCSQGYCSYYCPQWCYFLFPPPSPSPPSKSPTLSPLLIAVITVLSTAFLLTAYYLIISKFRRHFPRSPPPPIASPHIDTPSVSQGLDETLINKIASCQYRPSDGLVVDGTDCSVCLGRFEDGDRLRMLPQCDHAFHLRCIDTWLRAHSTCPLCRASIVVVPVVPNRIVEVESESSASPSTIEIEEGGGRFLGRSLSMDSTFPRRVTTDSARWNRALHCVMSPVRMKRSLSEYSRQVGRGRSAVLPI